MATISIKLSEQEVINTFKKIKEFRIDIINKNIKYAFEINKAKVIIYNTNSMVIQGSKPHEIYKIIFNRKYLDINDAGFKKHFDQTKINSIGSDEVGVGDFFGGLVVAAALVSTNDITWLKSIGVKDSKLLNDEKIMEIYNLIKNRIKHIVVIASPKDYNNMFNTYKNSHIIKAVMHNKALTKMITKTNEKYFVVIDEFASEKNYYNYLNISKEKPIKIDISTTKAESKYLCVACASIIARVHFLKQIRNLSDELEIELPLGSSNKTIPLIAKRVILNYGKEKFSDYCKKHFVTYNKIMGE